MPNPAPWIIFSNAVNTAPGDPRHRAGDYVRDPVSTIRGWFDTAARHRYTRVMLMLPTGVEDIHKRREDGTIEKHAAQAVSSWGALEAQERDTYEESIVEWVRSGREVGLYSGLREAPSPESVRTTVSSPLLNDEAYWRASVAPWIERGVTTVLFDTLGGRPYYLPRLQRWAGPGVTIGGEAHPLKLAAGGVYDLDQATVSKGAPWVMMASTMEDRDPRRRMHAYPGTDCRIWWLQGAGDPRPDAECVELIRDWKRRGYAVDGSAVERPVLQAALASPPAAG